MTEFLDAWALFHLLRPAWMGLLVPIALLWWRVRSRATARPAPPPGLAPHLAEALTVGRAGRTGFVAVDGVAATLALIAIAAAGPAWTRIPSPFVSDTAPLAIVLSTAETMRGVDVAPDRLERAKHKILDLLALRGGARTALVAYAGTAHRVVPLTEDPAILKPFVEALSPDVMPEPGADAAAALALARAALAAEAIPGAILFVLDTLDPASLPAFVAHAEDGGPGVVFLQVASDAADTSTLRRVPRARVVRVTPDATDVGRIERRVASVYREALLRDERQQWEDRGWLLAMPAALLTLLYFRRGWTMSLGFLLVLGASTLSPSTARADGLVDLFLTDDQRGRLAFEAGRYEEAADVFVDPMWKGYAMSFLGRYAEAAQVYAKVATADAADAQGVALVRAREYRRAIQAFETALARDPDHPSATGNLETARAILAYLERLRAQTDTGEGSEGADEVVFDEEMEGGKAVMLDERDRLEVESAEQWMRTVETRASEFLSIRFALEAALREEAQ